MNYCTKKPPGKLWSALVRAWPILLVVIFILSSGLLIGSLAANKMDNSKAQDLSIYVREFVQKAPGVNFDSAKMTRNSMVNNVIMVAAIYVLGLTVIGIPFVIAILFMRGFVIGFAVGFLAKDLSLGGVLLTMAAIFPHNLLNFPALCVGASSSIMFSMLLLKRNFNTSVKIWPNLVSYTVLMGGVLVVTLAASMVEGYLTPVFTKMAAGIIKSRLGL